MVLVPGFWHVVPVTWCGDGLVFCLVMSAAGGAHGDGGCRAESFGHLA